MATHEARIMGKDEWLTPPWLLTRLGEFDLDPCSPHESRRPWATAKRHYCREDNGLNHPWDGRVWLNPPYGKFAAQWYARLAEHGDGIALLYARTDTESFFDHVWSKADAILFIKGRVLFHHVSGARSRTCGGAASVLVAYGDRNVRALEACADLGKVIYLKPSQVQHSASQPK
jgi:DNA N-6-adenine-methyltransferase (Dam)